MTETPSLKEQFAYYMRVELGRRQTTIETYLRRLGRLEERFGKPAEDITSADLRGFKAEPGGQSRSAIKAHLVALHQFHIWGELEGLWPHKDTALVRTPTVDDVADRPALSADKVRALLEACQRPRLFDDQAPA